MYLMKPIRKTIKITIVGVNLTYFNCGDLNE